MPLRWASWSVLARALSPEQRTAKWQERAGGEGGGSSLIVSNANGQSKNMGKNILSAFLQTRGYDTAVHSTSTDTHNAAAAVRIQRGTHNEPPRSREEATTQTATQPQHDLSPTDTTQPNRYNRATDEARKTATFPPQTVLVRTNNVAYLVQPIHHTTNTMHNTTTTSTSSQTCPIKHTQ